MIDWLKVFSFAMIVVGIVIHEWSIFDILIFIVGMYTLKKYILR